MSEPGDKKRLTIKDARGRTVTQLDPVAMHLLRKHDIIEPEVLAVIAREPGVRIAGKERAALIVGVVCLLAVASLFTWSLIVGNLGGAALAKTSSLIYFCAVPWVIWYVLKRRRFAKVTAAMLEHRRCPHCGYDLRLLPVDESDGATVCPECGCAWTLPDTSPDDEVTGTGRAGRDGR